MNLHIKRPKITVNQRIGSRKEVISGLYIWEISDNKTAYNEGCLYIIIISIKKLGGGRGIPFIGEFAYMRLRNVVQNSLYVAFVFTSLAICDF